MATGGKSSQQRDQKYPWQLAVAVISWIVLGAVLVVGALSSNKSKSEADQGSVDAIQSSLGNSYASAGQSGVNAPLWLMLGGAVLLLALLLLVGQGWARHALALLGLVAVVVRALGDHRGVRGADPGHGAAAVAVGAPVPERSLTTRRRRLARNRLAK